MHFLFLKSLIQVCEVFKSFKVSEAEADEYHQEDYFETPDAAKYTLQMAFFFAIVGSYGPPKDVKYGMISDQL